MEAGIPLGLVPQQLLLRVLTGHQTVATGGTGLCDAHALPVPEPKQASGRCQLVVHKCKDAGVAETGAACWLLA